MTVDELIEQFARLLTPAIPAAASAAPVEEPAAAPAPAPPQPTTLETAPAPATAGTPSPPNPPRPPVQATSHAAKGFDLDVSATPDQVVAAAELLDRHGFALDSIAGVDWIAEGQCEVVYDYFHPVERLRVAVRARISREKPTIPTISKVFAGANWHERETHDFFGIVFEGHPNLEPLLLPEDATYHPLRKDFTA